MEYYDVFISYSHEDLELAREICAYLTGRGMKCWFDENISAGELSSVEESPYYTVFGSEYRREEILSVTFLDSTEGAPESAWDVSDVENDSYLAWVEENGDGYDLYIAAEGGVRAPENSAYLFSGYINAIKIDFNGCFDTSGVTNMSHMFYGCSSLTELDLSGFDTSEVTDMGYMFYECLSLESLNVSDWNTSQVTTFYAAFYRCENLAQLDVSDIETALVTNMAFMFAGCSALTDLDLSGFDTAKVTEWSDFMAETDDWEILFETTSDAA